MNSRFKKYIKALYDPSANETVVESVLEELHSSFATLTQEQQKHANIFLHDIQSGDAQLNDEKTFQDYITEYAAKEKNQQIDTLVKTFGIKKDKLTELIDAEPNENTLNEYGRFDALKETVDENLAATYFDNIHEPEPKLFRRRMKIATILKEYILYQTMPKELEEPDTPN